MNEQFVLEKSIVSLMMRSWCDCQTDPCFDQDSIILIKFYEYRMYPASVTFLQFLIPVLAG